MPPRNSSVELAGAVEALARRAADRRTRPQTLAEKRALAAGDLLTAIGSDPALARRLAAPAPPVKAAALITFDDIRRAGASAGRGLADAASAVGSSPLAQGALTHGRHALESLRARPLLARTLAGGALGAGLGGLAGAAGGLGKEPEDRPGVLRSALLGGLTGAGLGLGYGALRDAQEAHAGPPAPPDRFRAPDTGRPAALSPEALRRRPDLAEKVRELAEPTTGEQAVGAVAGGLGLAASHAPLSTFGLPALAGADFALHNNTLRLGDRLGVGMIDPRFSRDPEHLRRGFEAIARLKPDAAGLDDGVHSLIREIQQNPGDAYKKMNATRQGVAFTQQVPGGTTGGAMSALTGSRTTPGKSVTIPETVIQQARELGTREHFANRFKDSKVPGSGEPRIFKGPFGERNLGPSPFRGARGVGRALAYLGVPAAELTLNALRDSSRRQKGLAELVAELRQQGLVRDAGG